MLPKNRRIKRQMFPGILSRGKKFISPHFMMVVLNEGRGLPSKFSFSISKKICKKAVDRNKYRRRGYSTISRYIKDVPAGFLFFFSYKKSEYPVSFDQIQKEITGLLQNIK